MRDPLLGSPAASSPRSFVALSFVVAALAALGIASIVMGEMVTERFAQTAKNQMAGATERRRRHAAASVAEELIASTFRETPRSARLHVEVETPGAAKESERQV